MRELWAAVEADEILPKNLEVNDNFIALLISRCIGGCDPVVCYFTSRKDAGVEVCSFACAAVEPETSCKFHASSLNHYLEINPRLDELLYEALCEWLIYGHMDGTQSRLVLGEFFWK